MSVIRKTGAARWPRTDYVRSPAEILVQDLLNHPNGPAIVKHVLELHYTYGFSPTSPYVVLAAMYAAEREVQKARTWPAPGVPRHESLVYYMRRGDQVKIGHTTNLPARLAAIFPEELLTFERGDASDEHARHRLFASLRTNGEWFRLQDPLSSYITAVQADFGNAFGSTLEEWMSRLQSTPQSPPPTSGNSADPAYLPQSEYGLVVSTFTASDRTDDAPSTASARSTGTSPAKTRTRRNLQTS